MAKPKKSEKHVIVRTHSAGVHYGTLVARRGQEVDLANAKRLWWQGANTLHEVSLRGVRKGGGVSERVAEISLTQAIEIITCEPAAVANLEAALGSGCGSGPGR